MYVNIHLLMIVCCGRPYLLDPPANSLMLYTTNVSKKGFLIKHESPSLWCSCRRYSLFSQLLLDAINVVGVRIAITATDKDYQK